MSSVCLFPSRSTVRSWRRGHHPSVCFGADIWGFQLFTASQGIFHVSFLWIPQQQVIYWWDIHDLLQVSYIAVTLKQTKAAKDRLSIPCLSSILLMLSVKLVVLACLLHICCVFGLKARDGTGTINRGYDGRRAAMNIRLFLSLCNQIYGG